VALCHREVLSRRKFPKLIACCTHHRETPGVESASASLAPRCPGSRLDVAGTANASMLAGPPSNSDTMHGSEPRGPGSHGAPTMARQWLWTFTALVCFVPATALGQEKASAPHIVFLLADDLGYTDVGFNGGDIKTPNLDKLARSGAILSAFHVQPVCSP